MKQSNQSENIEQELGDTSKVESLAYTKMLPKFGPFAYTCDRSVQVYEQSTKFIETSDLSEKISNLSWAYFNIGGVIPHTTENFWSGHFFPWVESWDEMQVSYNLCLFGFYKQSMVSLRSSLELGLLSVYWNLNDEGHKIIQDWLKSKKDTPRLGEIWKKLEQHKNFALFQQQYDIKTRLLSLNYLHDYVHTKGHKYSNRMGLRMANFQTFEEKAFKTWLDGFEEVAIVLSLLHLIKYPIGVIKYDYSRKFGIDIPSFGGLTPSCVEQLESIIGQDIFQKIEWLAITDENVTNVMEWISSLPDMSQEDVNNQIIEMNKEEIKGIGLEQWLDNTKAMYEDLARNDEMVKHMIEYLISWAKENGYEKSVYKRPAA